MPAAPCYLTSGLVDTAKIVGWYGHKDFSLALHVPRWVPDAVLEVTVPSATPLIVKKVYWASLLGGSLQR